MMLVSAANSAPLRNFVIALQGGDFTAGAPAAVTITAYDTENQVKTDYEGAGTGVTFSAETGDVFVEETSSSVSGVFAGGRWTGKIQFWGADSANNLVCIDASGATGTAVKNISAGQYSKLLILTQGQIPAPGTVSGYSGGPETLRTYLEFGVTVTACDDYYNPTLNWTSAPQVRMMSGGSLGTDYDVTPSGMVDFSATDVQGTTLYAMTITPNPDSSGTYDIIADDTASPVMKTVLRQFTSLNTYYMWAEVNSGVTDTAGVIPVFAGETMTVTVKVSHFPREDNEELINDFTKPAGIKAVKYNNLQQEALLLDPNQVLVDGGSGSAPVVYTAVDRIKIMPVYDDLYPDNQPGDSYVTKTASNTVQVFAAAPASMSLTADAVQLSAGQNCVLRADVYDAYGNKVSSTAVNYTVISGGGELEHETVYTDDYDYAGGYAGGRAENTYTAPDSAGAQAVIRAEAAGVDPVSVSIELVSTAGVGSKKEIKNTPNPFDPARQSTIIAYYLEKNSSVRMRLFNIFGNLVWEKSFDKGGNYAFSGPQEYPWDGKTNGGFTVGAGLYVLKIDVENEDEKYTLTRKIAVKK